MGKIPSRERSNYTLRLSEYERARLVAAAAKRPEHLAEYVRRVALEAAADDLAATKSDAR